jgi:hypothetical protein
MVSSPPASSHRIQIDNLLGHGSPCQDCMTLKRKPSKKKENGTSPFSTPIYSHHAS